MRITISKVNVMRKIAAATLLAALFFFAACTEKKEQQEETQGQEVSKEEIKITKGTVQEAAPEAEHKGMSKSYYYMYDKKEGEGALSFSGAEETFTPVEAAKRVRSPYEHVQIDLLKKKLSKNFIQKCSACHDDYANGVIGPSLLGRDGEFIYKRLLEYRSQEKVNVLMKDLVNKMDEKELRSLAEEIAEFNKEIRALRKEQ